jgi:beta-lactamase regulating signal transducer with metallopeptidase domain/protocatechuate 3,4-dioxygenase beta subunit
MNPARLDLAPVLHRALAAVAAHPLLERLFFASLELAVLALLVFAAIRLGRMRSPRLAALLWLLVLGKPLLSLTVGTPFHLFRMDVPAAVVAAPPPLVPATHADPPAAAMPPASFEAQSPLPDGMDEEMAGAPFAPPHQDTTPAPATPPVVPVTRAPAPPTRTSPPWSPATWILGIWLTGVACFAGLSLVDRARAWRLVRAARKPEPSLSNRYSALAANMGLKRPAALRITDEMESPALVGSIFSTIVIPGWLAEDANEAKLDWALRHELMHFRLRDPWAALVRELSQMLFYFHPVAWWAGAKWKTATEKACDRAIVADEAAARDYAEQLYRILVGIHGRRQAALRTGLFATRTQIGQRIAALLYGPRTAPHLSAVAIAVVGIVTAVTLSVGGAFADKNAKRDEPENTAAVAATDKGAEPQPAPISASTTSQPAPAPAPDVTFTYAGTVVDDHGKPVAGVQIDLDYLHASNPSGPVSPLAVTDSKGRFEFSRRKRDFAGAERSGPWSFPAMLVATKPGYGPAGRQSIEFETTGRLVAEQDRPPGWHPKGWSNVLKLAFDDVPIHGRILDTEGRPVVGALVETINLWEGRDGSLDTWEAATRRPGADLKGLEEKLRPINFSNRLTAPYPTLVPAVRTDASGSFTLAGLGRERLADLAVSAPGIETTPLHVRTRRGAVINVLPDNWNPKSGQETFYPCDFTRVAGPSVTVEGQVTDGRSHRPLAGIRVHAARIISWPFRDDDLAGRLIAATTDAGGHYRLEGLPPGFARLGVIPPPGSRYLMAGVDVRIGMRRSPLAVDIKLGAGVMVRGRVTDSRTGMPTQGSLQYFAFWTNPHLQEAPGFGISGFMVPRSICNYRCDADGRFELPVLPGPGILAFRADRGSQFPEAVGAAEIHGPKGQDGAEFSTAPYDCQVEFFHLLTPLNPQPGTDSLALDLTVRSPAIVTGTVRGPEGKPLSHYSLSNKSSFLEEASRWGRQKGARFEINGARFEIEVYSPTDHHRLMFYHQSRNLVGFHEFTGEPSGPLEITLQPGATLKGRLVDDGGQPLEEVSLVISARQAMARENRAAESRAAAAATGPRLDQSQITTDNDGRFELRGVVPGLAYSVVAQGAITSRAGRRVPGGPVFTNILAQAGETKELGDLRIGAAVKPAAEPAKAKDDQSQMNAARGRAGEPAAFAEVRRSGPESAAAAEVTFNYVGTVVDDQGKPVAGAKISLDYLHASDSPGPFPTLAVTDGKGRFEFSRRKRDFADSGLQGPWWFTAMIAATKPGYGPAGGRSVEFETTGHVVAEQHHPPGWHPQGWSNVLKLAADDVPIHGRVVDTEGRPVSGAVVQAINVWEGRDGSLDAWEAAALRPGAGLRGIEQKLRPINYSNGLTAPRPTFVPAVRTDASGSFTLSGLGRERLADLAVSGPGIETALLHVRTRRGAVVKLPQSERNRRFGEETVYPCDFTRVAGPSVPVEGHVTDARSQRPLSGIGVNAARIPSSPFTDDVAARLITATTDARGHYRLEGLPLGETRLGVIPPLGSRYLMVGIDVKTRMQPSPVVADIKLAAGVMVRGRVTDSRTGMPVEGSLEYFAFWTNPHLEEAPGYENSGFLGGRAILHYRCDADGRFEIPVLPGRGILAYRADALAQLPRGIGAADIDGPKERWGFSTAPSPCDAERFHLLKALNPQPGTDSLALDLTVRSPATVTGTVRGPEGKPLVDYSLSDKSSFFEEVSRQSRQTVARVEINGATFEVKVFSPTDHHRLMFYHRSRNLVGFREFTGEPSGPLDITLEPAATLKGRVVDDGGQPLGDVSLSVTARQAVSGGNRAAESKAAAAATGPQLDQSQITTDKDGRFELRRVLPGLEYSAVAQGAITSRAGRRIPGGPVFTNILARTGETKELGDLRIASADGKSAGARPERNDNAEVNVVHGRVLLPNDKPAAGAKVFALRRFGTDRLKRTPLEKTTSGPDGQFTIRVPRRIPNDEFGDDFLQTRIAVEADGFGAQCTPWHTRGNEYPQEVVLKLLPELPIHGRIVDLEGRAVRDARVSLLWQETPRRGFSAWLASAKSGDLPRRDLLQSGLEFQAFEDDSRPPLVTDAEGRFSLRGVGADRLVQLMVQGETIVSARIAVVTYPTEAFRLDGRRRTEQIFGAEFTYQAPPTRPIVGIVRDAVTGTPLAGVSIESPSERGIRTETDAQGRYRLVGLAKARQNVINVVPNPDQPYFARKRVNVPESVGLAPITLDFNLTRGTWITGRVTDKATGAPVHAFVVYLPGVSNSLAEKIPEFATTDADRLHLPEFSTGPDGRYRLVGLPGRGVVAGWARGQYAPDAAASQMGRMVQDRYFASLWRKPAEMNFLKEINVAPGSPSQTRDFVVDAGGTLRISIVDQAGKPVHPCICFYNTSGAMMEWGINDSPCDLRGFVPGESRPLLFLEGRRHLGKAVVAHYDPKAANALTVTLEPCATVKGRLIDEEGIPIKSREVTPIARGRDNLWLSIGRTNSDSDGRFILHNLVPGTEFYTIFVHGFGNVAEKVVVAAGKTIDLGDIKLKRRNSATPAATTSTVPENPPPSKAKSVAEVNEVQGRVLLPDGKPAAGAKVFALRRFWSARVRRTPLDKTTANADGTFVLRFPKNRPYDGFGVSGNFAVIAAQTDGFGPDWQRWLPRSEAAKEVVLKLVADSPIHGRIVDLEGKPVAGVQVSWRWQNTPRPTMATWLAAIKSGDVAFRQTGNGGELPASDDDSNPPVVTDSVGHFTIKGIGADRVARLELRGETIAYAEVDVVNRAIEPIRYQNPLDVSGRLFGSEFTYQAAPTQPLVGTVRDAASGAPLAGVSIESRRLAGVPGAEDGAVRTQTDAQGRYRLVGLQKGNGDGSNDRNLISVIPNDEQPYFMLNQVRVPKVPGLAPVTLDFKLTRGLWITGRATDKVTGKPVPCRLIYAPFLSNPLAANLPEFKKGAGGHGSDLTRYMARPDGTFRLVGLPGRGLVAAKSMGRLYSLSGGATDVMTKNGKFPTYLPNETAGMNVVEEINPAPGTESVTRDLVFNPGRTVRLSVVDGDGKPVGRCLYAFSEIGGGSPIGWSQDAMIEMAGMAPHESRHVLIHDRERHLGKVITLHDDEKAPQIRTVTLEPCATLKGRFVDADGVPVKNVNLYPGARGEGYWLGETGLNRSDADGKFQLDLPPGAEYYTIFAPGFGNIADKLVVAAGKTIDLGAIKVTRQK